MKDGWFSWRFKLFSCRFQCDLVPTEILPVIYIKNRRIGNDVNYAEGPAVVASKPSTRSLLNNQPRAEGSYWADSLPEQSSRYTPKYKKLQFGTLRDALWTETISVHLGLRSRASSASLRSWQRWLTTTRSSASAWHSSWALADDIRVPFIGRSWVILGCGDRWIWRIVLDFGKSCDLPAASIISAADTKHRR